MFKPLIVLSIISGAISGETYGPSILIFNNTLIIAVLAVALYKINKILNEMPEVA